MALNQVQSSLPTDVIIWIVQKAIPRRTRSRSLIEPEKPQPLLDFCLGVLTHTADNFVTRDNMPMLCARFSTRTVKGLLSQYYLSSFSIMQHISLDTLKGLLASSTTIDFFELKKIIVTASQQEEANPRLDLHSDGIFSPE